MPINEDLQIHCLSLLTTFIQFNHDDGYVPLLDKQTKRNNSNVKKLVTNLKKVAKGESNSVPGLIDCFDFITGGPESRLNLSQPLHPIQQQHLHAIYRLLNNKSHFELKSLNKFELGLYSILTFVVNKNLDILPQETIACLQKALLGDEDQQLHILTHLKEILNGNIFPILARLIDSLGKIADEFNAVFNISAKNLHGIEEEVEKEKCNYTLIRSLFDNAYDAALCAIEISYPKTEQLITIIQDYQYEFAYAHFLFMQEAMKQKQSAEIIEGLIVAVKSWVAQCVRFQHPESQKLLGTIEELEKNKAQANFETAKQLYERVLRRRDSNYKSQTFKTAMEFAKLAKEQGSPHGEILYNDIVNTPLESDINKINNKINVWLANYENNWRENVPEEINTELARLRSETKSRKSVDLSLVVSLLDCSFKVIDARNFLAKGNYEDAKEIVDKIKDKKSLHTVFSSIETLVNWYLVNQPDNAKKKKTKALKKIEETKTEEPTKLETRRKITTPASEQKDEEDSYHSPLTHLHQNLQPAASKPVVSPFKKQISSETSSHSEPSDSSAPRRVSFQDSVVTNSEQSSVPSSTAENFSLQASVDKNSQPESTVTSTKRVSFQKPVNQELEAIPPKKRSSYFIMQTVITPPIPLDEPKNTNEKMPLLTPTSRYSINTSEQSPKRKRRNFLSAFGIFEIVVGLMFAIAGGLILGFCPPVGIALILGCTFLGVGVLKIGIGTSVLMYQNCHSPNKDEISAADTQPLKNETKLKISEPRNFRHVAHPNPANMFPYQQGNNKASAARLIDKNGLAESSENTYSAF